MFEFIAVVVLANLILLAVLYVLRHVIAIRAPVLLIAVGISILYCILYPFLMALVSYPQVLYLYVFLVVAGAGSLYVIESRLFAVGELNDYERPVEAGVIVYIPESGLPEDMEEAADMAAGTESADVPVEDKPAMADKITEVYITEDEVAALLKAVDNGRLEGAEEDMSFYTEDEIAAVEEGPGPADIQVEGLPGREDPAAGEITATLEELDAADPVETMEEAGFSGADGKDSAINIEEFLPVEEEIVLVYEEEAAVPDGEWPVPESGLSEGLPETAYVAAEVVEDVQGLSDQTIAGHITADEVAAILDVAGAGEQERAGEDISFYAEDEIAAVEEGPEPADIQVEGVPGRDDSAAGEITATLEELDAADPVETMEEAGFSGADGKDSAINIEEFLPVEEESVLVYEEEAAVPDGEWPVPETGLSEGLPVTAHVAAEVVEDVPGLSDQTIAGHITADEVAAILEVAGAGEQERAGEDISFYGPDNIAAFEEGLEPAEVVVDITVWDDVVADEITATLEGPDTEVPVEHESTEETAAVAGEEYGDIAELMEDPESTCVPVEECRDLDDGFAGREVAAGIVSPAVLPYRAAEEQTLPGDDLSSLVAMAFDKLASGDSAGAVDSFFRALKLGPPPKLAVMLCTRISSIYSSQGLHRQALAVMEMLEVVWGPMLDDSDREGITTIIIQLRGEL